MTKKALRSLWVVLIGAFSLFPFLWFVLTAATLPLILLALLFQRRIVRGLSVGAVKG